MSETVNEGAQTKSTLALHPDALASEGAHRGAHPSEWVPGWSQPLPWRGVVPVSVVGSGTTVRFGPTAVMWTVPGLRVVTTDSGYERINIS